jgi:hypothetical protein
MGTFDVLTFALGFFIGTPTKRQVSKCQVSKHAVSKRPVSKRQVYKTSGFKTSGFKMFGFKTFIEIKASKRLIFKFDTLIQQNVRELQCLNSYLK